MFFLYESYVPFVSDYFSTYLKEVNGISSNNKYKGNGLYEYVIGGISFKLKEEFFSHANGNKLITLRWLEEKSKEPIFTVNAIIIVIKEDRKSDHFVIINDNILSKKVIRTVNKNRVSSAVKFINNKDYSYEDEIKEIILNS